MNEDKIRELLKDPSDEYYVSVFKKISDTGKTAWNWGAFCGGFCWAAYRKMYCFALLCFLSTFLPSYLFLGKDLAIPASYVASGIFFGAFGNNIYCYIIKKRIKNGYHLDEKYKGSSPILLYLNATVFGAIAAFILWIRDRLSVKEAVENRKPFNTDLNEKNIRAVVSSKVENHYLNKFLQIESGKLISLNWAACFGESFWFIYKKMYAYGFALLAISLTYYVLVLGDSILVLFGEDENAALSLISSGIFWLKALALKAAFLFGSNRLYYHWAKNK